MKRRERIYNGDKRMKKAVKKHGRSVYSHTKKRSTGRRVITVFAVCLLALALSGCGLGNGNHHQVTAIGRVSTQNSAGISSKHELLNGREKSIIHVPHGQTFAVLIRISNQEGSLSLMIGKNDHPPVYTGNSIESGTFTVYLRESGDYSVIVDADKHKGSYSLNWSIADCSEY